MRKQVYPATVMVAIGFFISSACPVSSHELKVFASQMVMDQPGRTVAFLSWGHALPTDELVAGETLADYLLVAPDGTKSTLKARDLSFQECEIECDQVGIYQLAAARKPSVFTYVYDSSGRRVMRRGGKKEVTDGKVDYSMRSHQFAKGLVIVGEADKVPIALGHALELVPLDPPSQWKLGSLLRIQVLRNGKPLPGEIITATYVGYRPQGAWCFAQESNRGGIVRVLLTQAGTWVLRVRHRQPAAASERDNVDYESYTATLTFEVRP